MTSLWIVDRDPRRRAALARLAAAPGGSVTGAPGDPLFDAASPPDAVILGLAEDFEAELQFAHRAGERLRRARVVLVGDRAELPRARRLFDSLDGDLLAYPPDSRHLRQLVRSARRAGAEPLPLSQRPSRDALQERFARWLGDLELPDLLHALNPRHADAPLLVTGEAGTGRGLVARYVHAFGGTSAGAFVHVACTRETSAEDVAAAIRAGCRHPRARVAASLWLEGVDELPAAAQREIGSWIEFGPPEGVRLPPLHRWIGTGEEEPEAALRQSLARIALEIPPLRERSQIIASFVNATADTWSSQRSEPLRRFGEDALAVLEEYPWPGNFRELEGVAIQTLLSSAANPIPAEDLQYEGCAFAPLDAGDIGDLLDENEEEEPLAELIEEIETLAIPEPAAEDKDLLPTELEEPGAAPPRATAADASLRGFVGALAHEVRNPLSTIRTFAELLPERFEDREFRERFSELVGQDVRRIEDVVDRLSQLATFAPPASDAVNVAALLETLLEERRVTIHERRLVVLRELDGEAAIARGDAEQLRFAFEALLNKALQLVPERGSLYLASRSHAAGLRGQPSVRVLLRFHGPRRGDLVAPVEGVSAAENSLEFAVTDAIVRAHGGAFAIDASEGGETVIVLDLPALSD